MSEYTPTTEYVKDFYAKFQANLSMSPGYSDDDYDSAEAEFDRWLEDELAAAERRGAERGWDAAADEVEQCHDCLNMQGIENPFRTAGLIVEGDDDD